MFTRLLVFFIVVVGLSAIQGEEIQLPVLAVKTTPAGKLEGALLRCTLTVTDRKVGKPLAVSVTEESPSAVGGQMRAAVWLAASTVSLEKGTPMTGFKIEIAFEGAVDGPSAGALIALGLLSVIDGRILPQDFAFTGTVLPNGCVGAVGGMTQKLQAAARAGKKRILVPNFYRVDNDANTGKQVDFKDLCESLGMEYIPVADLNEAYSKVHHLEIAKVAPAHIRLSPVVERILKDSYKEQVERGDNIFNALPESEKEELGKDEFFTAKVKRARFIAENSMREGNFVLAEENAILWSAFLQARDRNQKFLAAIKAKDNSDLLHLLSREISIKTKFVQSKRDSYTSSKSWTNKLHASEIDDYGRELPQMLGVVDLIAAQSQPLADELQRPGGTKSAVGRSLEELQSQFIINRLTQLIFLNLADEVHAYSLRRMESFAKLYGEKSRGSGESRAACENLLFTAMMAADESFTADSIQQFAKQAGLTTDEAKSRLALNNISYLTFGVQKLMCIKSHEGLMENPAAYPIASAAQDHGFALASVTRQMLAVQCGWDQDASGKSSYANAGLVRFLLESSKNEAVAAITRCESRGIPCWNPIMLVLSADGKREDSDEDRMDVIEQYLQAGIQAKTLALLFAEPKS